MSGGFRFTDLNPNQNYKLWMCFRKQSARRNECNVSGVAPVASHSGALFIGIAWYISSTAFILLPDASNSAVRRRCGAHPRIEAVAAGVEADSSSVTLISQAIRGKRDRNTFRAGYNPHRGFSADGGLYRGNTLIWFVLCSYWGRTFAFYFF